MSRDNVRGLMLFQPHAALVVLGHKELETRDWLPGPESGTPDGWTGTLLITSAPDSAKHDEWMLKSFVQPTVFRLQKTIYSNDASARNGKQGESIMSSGCILGAVDLVKVGHIKTIIPEDKMDKIETGSVGLVIDSESDMMPVWAVSRQEIDLGMYAPDRYGWLLANPRRLPTPIPFVGRRRLFEIPEEILQQIEAQGVTL